MGPRRYVLLLLATVALALAAAGSAVVLVDPYAVLHSRIRPGFNAAKPAIDRRAELWKADLLAREQPQLAILGNSRAEVGFDAGHPAFAGLRVVNAALTRASFAEIELLFRQALHSAAPQRFVIAIDLKSLTDTAVRPGMAQARIGEDIGEDIGKGLGSLHRAWNLLKVHLSLDALADAAGTVRRQTPADPPSLLLGEHGNRSDAYMAHLIAAGGGSGAFSRGYLRDDEPLKTAAVAQLALDANLQRLRRMAAAACARHIRIDFILPPVHAEMLEFWHRKYGDAFLPGSVRQATAALAEAAGACPGGRFALWTAMAYTPVTTEPIPGPQAGAAAMANYWEVVHFRRAVGDAVLEAVFGNGVAAAGPSAVPAAASATPVVRLDRLTVEPYLAALAEARAAWRAGR